MGLFKPTWMSKNPDTAANNTQGRWVCIVAYALAVTLTSILCLSCTSTQSGTAGSSEPAAMEEDSEQVEYTYSEEDYEGWAREVFVDSLSKLVNEGDLEYSEEGNLFSYTIDGSDKFVSFLNEDAQERYTETPISIQGKVILCEYILSKKYDSFSVYRNIRDAALWSSTKPQYYPLWPSAQNPFEDADYAPSLFADSLGECDFLIVYGGYESLRNEAYYMDAIDRIETTTMVFVIDAKNRQLLHIENIGTVNPASSTRSDQTTGPTMTSESAQYIQSLLTS